MKLFTNQKCFWRLQKIKYKTYDMGHGQTLTLDTSSKEKEEQEKGR